MATLVRNFRGVDSRGNPGSWHHYSDGRKVFVADKGASKAPGATAAPAASPAAATTGNYGFAPQPIDPELENQKAVGRQQIALGEAQDVYDQKRLSNEYGIGDTSNPFSRAKMLEQTFRRSQATNTNSYAGRGQLYSGALQTQLDEDQNVYNRGTDSMQRAYQAAQNEITKRRGERYGQYGQQLDSATYQSLLRALGA